MHSNNITLFQTSQNLRYFLVRLLFIISIQLSYGFGFCFTIVIDPGHGGEDKGATQGSLFESQIALKVALKLATQLEKAPNTRVILTRSGDQSISLKNRVLASETNKADLFISLHGNSSLDKRAKGAEFYIANSIHELEPQDQKQTVNTIVNDLTQKGRLYQSQYLATETFSIWKEESKNSGMVRPRSIKQAPFFVINKNNIPSMLVEFGFITNHQESLELVKEEKQDQIANNLFAAVQEYRKSLKEN